MTQKEACDAYMKLLKDTEDLTPEQRNLARESFHEGWLRHMPPREGAAFANGAAARQPEIDRLHAEIERLKTDLAEEVHGHQARLYAEIERLKADWKPDRGSLVEYQLLAEAQAEIEQLKAKIATIEEAAKAAYRYHMLGYKDAEAFNANIMLDHMNKLGEVL